MKKQIKKIGSVFLLTLIGFTSCTEKQPTQDEIVKKNAEEYLKPKLNDPNSYEFVKLELIDSILYSDNIKYRKENFQKDIEYNKENLERQASYKTEIPSIYKEEEVDELNDKIAKNDKILLAIDSLETALGSKKNDVASYTYIFSFRGNNALGAKILNEYIVQTDPKPELTINNMTDDKDKVFLNPNDFPGYREMIVKYIN
jgi:hypothetical protein